VIATERYIAADGADAVEVEYEPLAPMMDPMKSIAPGAPLLRKDKKDKKDNIAFHWEAGDRAATDRALAACDVVAEQDVYVPRIHVASMETCGCVADFDAAQGKLTVHMTTQAPHAVQEAFHQEHALQCGFCTPGMLMTTSALLERNKNPSELEIRQAISGNLCRCTGYLNIVKAVQYAAEKMARPS